MEDAVLHTVPVPAHVRNPRVPQAFSDVCMRMLEKAPEARYPDVEAVGGALEAGTVLTGRLLFGKERVYGRFTEARRPSGESWGVCLEFVEWSNEKRVNLRGVTREPDGGPDTAQIFAGPDVRAVERFE